MKTCPNCGATNEDAGEFCGLCWQKFSEPGPPAPYRLRPEPTTSTASPAVDGGPGRLEPVAEPLDSHFVLPAPESILKSKQKSVLLPSMELLGNAFSYFMDNLKFYVLLSLTVSILVVIAIFTIGGAAFSSLMPLIANGQPSPGTMPRLSSNLVWSFLALGAVVGFFGLLGQLAFMIATAEMAKGYDLSVFAALFEALKKIFSFIWIAALQAVLAGGIILAGIALTAALKGQSPLPLVIGVILGTPVAAVVGTWFSLAAYVYLDTGTRGLAALAASKELIGARWPSVWWRFFSFALAMGVLQAIPVIGWLISGFVLTPLSAIFPWLLYANLKHLNEAAA